MDGWILGDLRPVNREGSYQGETKRIPTTSANADSLLNTHSTVEDWKNTGKNDVERAGISKTTLPHYDPHIRSMLFNG